MYWQCLIVATGVAEPAFPNNITISSPRILASVRESHVFTLYRQVDNSLADLELDVTSLPHWEQKKPQAHIFITYKVIKIIWNSGSQC